MAEAKTPPAPQPDPWRALLHRWFVEYNPFYLLSAAIVLAGLTLLTRSLDGETPYARLGISALGELYAVSLIASAALLTRMNQRRSAVMLSMLAVFYQGDLTLHTDTSPDLGLAGAFSSIAWLALAIAKLLGLARAMRVRLSHETIAATTLGALGLSALPFLLTHVEPRTASSLVMLWLFALATLARRATITTDEPLDPWGHTVLRRATTTAWALLAAPLALHLGFWSERGLLALPLIAPLAGLLLARRVTSQTHVLAIVAATVAFSAFALPSSLSATALIASVTLALHAEAAFSRIRSPIPTAAAAPYRSSEQPSPAADTVDHASLARTYLVSAILTAHLAAWTLGWHGGPFPAHILPLDLVTAASLTAALLRLRALASLPTSLTLFAHLAWQTRISWAPRTLQGWGALTVVAGFALLGASLAASYLLRARPTPQANTLSTQVVERSARAPGRPHGGQPGRRQGPGALSADRPASRAPLEGMLTAPRSRSR